MTNAAPQSEEPQPLRDDELEIVDEQIPPTLRSVPKPADKIPPTLRSVPKPAEPPAVGIQLTAEETEQLRELQRRERKVPPKTEEEKTREKLGIRKYSTNELEQDQKLRAERERINKEDTTFGVREPEEQKYILPLPREFFQAPEGKVDLDVLELQRKIRAAIRKASRKAQEGPIPLGRNQAGTQTGAEILRRAYGLPEISQEPSVVETLSGPMGVMSGLMKPHSLLMTFRDKKVFAGVSPGPKAQNAKEYEPNSVGVTVLPDSAGNNIKILVSQGLGEVPYIRDDAAACANAGIVEGASLLLSGDKIPPPTMINMMDKSVHEEEMRRGINKQEVSLLSAELDTSKGLLRVGNAGDIRCIIINPLSGSVLTAKPVTGEKTKFSEYLVPQNSIVLFATGNFVQSMKDKGLTPEKVLGQYFRRQMKKGASVDEVCAALIKNHHLLQADKKAPLSSFGVVGLQVPTIEKGPLVAKEVVRGPKLPKEPLTLDL